MRIRCVTGLSALLAALMLVGCGGGGGGGDSVSMTEQPNTPQTPAPPPNATNNRYEIHPGLTASDAKRSPIYRTGNLLRIGVDQGAGPERLPETAIPGFPDVSVRYGRLNDGAGASLRQYLIAASEGYDGISERRPGYEVRVIGSSSLAERNRVLAAVQLVNAALPENAKLSVGSPLSGFSLRDTISADGLYFRSGRESPNTIYVEFVNEFHNDSAATSWGDYIQMRRYDNSAYTNERSAVILTAHELIHSLGIGGHPPADFDTIMESTSRIYDHAQGSRHPASLLYPIDREALRALYGPLRNSTDPDDLGPWASTSEHFFISNAHGAFGVARRNGYAEPWAYGTAPATDLAANRQLSGSAAWNGALVGFTPAARRVAGNAGIAVNLASLDGTAAFTELATIEGNGLTAQWGDGDLRYTIAVRGNTFRETGGDDGRLTGIFAGRSHEAAGGTLERTDLTAAFGAVRE